MINSNDKFFKFSNEEEQWKVGGRTILEKGGGWQKRGKGRQEFCKNWRVGIM